jgi:mycothiol synthase
MARARVALPEGYTARPHVFEDAESAAELVGDCEELEDGVREVSAADLRALWSRPEMNLEEHSLAVFHGDRLAASADVFRDRAEVDVHPDHRGRGLGSALIPWTWEKARAQGATRVGQTFTDTRKDGRRLMAAFGYEPRWIGWDLRMPIRDIHPRPLPSGYAIRPLDPALDARSVFEVINTAFNEWRDEWQDDFPSWQETIARHESLAPWASPVAEHDGRIVGAAIGQDHGDVVGWIQQLAVAREHRGRGLGSALLETSYSWFRDRGKTEGGVATNSLTGALDVYERLGMRVRFSHTHWSKDLA